MAVVFNFLIKPQLETTHIDHHFEIKIDCVLYDCSANKEM